VSTKRNRAAILLVEDNPADQHLTLQAFRKLATPSTTFAMTHDGAEALEYLEGAGRYAADPPALPKLVLLDLKLPRMSGLEVLRRIRAREWLRHLPVVIFTSSSDGAERMQSYAFGATAYVRKPVDFDEFVQAADTLWRFWQQVDVAPLAAEQRLQ
jgi:two-component system response regulator